MVFPVYNTIPAPCARPTYTFPDTGVYTVRFFVNKDEPCTDSASHPDECISGFFSRIQFSWHLYSKPGNIQGHHPIKIWNSFLLVSGILVIRIIREIPRGLRILPINTVIPGMKICHDDRCEFEGMPGYRNQSTGRITDKPLIFFPFRDTLICNIDTLQLHARGFGNFTWSPAANMINPNTPDPSVYPKTTTWYTATLDQSGCMNSDSLRVRVVDNVTSFSGK